MAKPTKSAPVRRRVRFLDEVGTERANVEVDTTPGTVVLLYDYPPDEFKPQHGWHVVSRGYDVVITAISGKTLTVTE